MEIGSLLLILALFIAVGWYVARPLFDRKATIVSTLPDQQDHEVSALMAERDRILDALHELDFDYALGKIPENDFPVQRAILLQRGAEALRRIDELTQQTPGDDAEARIEAVVSARLTDAAQAAVQMRSRPSWHPAAGRARINFPVSAPSAAGPFKNPIAFARVAVSRWPENPANNQ
jgi:hypothetical protein